MARSDLFFCAFMLEKFMNFLENFGAKVNQYS